MSHDLDRRAFIRTAGGAVAAATVIAPGSAPARAAEPSGRDIRKAVKLGMVKGEMTLREKFALLKELGFDGVEPDSPNGYDADEMRRARDETGLAIHGVVCSEHWRSPFSHPDPSVRAKGRAAMETALRECHRYGGTTVLLVPAVVGKSVSYGEAWERSQKEIRTLLPLAEELGVKIALENVWNHFLLSPLEAARYVDDFESPWIGWYFDVGNIVNYGWPEQWVETLGPRILKLDVKEYSRGRRDREGLWKGFDVKLLDGDCDWPAVMTALDAIGFSGWATAEIPGGDRARLAEIAERMDRIIAS